VGGVAAGKSTVAKIFAAHGLAVVDADAAARAATADPGLVARLVAQFGPGIAKDGRLDRAALAQVVFRDPAARQQLEAILHPPTLAALDAALATALASGTSVLLDAPLLFETGLDRRCTAVVFVAAPAAVRQARATARGWPADELERREAAQWPLADKLARCRFTVDNGGELDATARDVAGVLAALASGTAPHPA
jgi:dephospho-CoA kinase